VTDLLCSASRYRERAAECVRLAEIAADPATRNGYCALAKAYLIMVGDELDKAEQRAQQKRLNPSG
jgi:hypothetical protein